MPDLPITYHRQDGWYLCGAACAQMVIEHLQGSLFDQGALYAHRCHDLVPENFWLTSPNGLLETLNDHRPSGFPGYFTIAASPNLDTISRKLVWTIHHYSVAPVALIRGDHWIVVRGFDSSAPPRGPEDLSYTISSFFINDPASGMADQHEPYASGWQTDLVALDSTLASVWRGQRIAICDSDPLPPAIGKQLPPPKQHKGKAILSPEEAMEAAAAGVNEFALAKRASWGPSLRDVHPIAPFLVQELDRADSFYYIVPLQNPHKAIPVLVCVDARFGVYLRAARIADPDGHALKDWILDRKIALEKVVGRSIDRGARGALNVRQEAYSLYPILVWGPCRESISPYWPFFLFTIGNARIYLRVDGKIFTRLHTKDHGI